MMSQRGGCVAAARSIDWIDSSIAFSAFPRSETDDGGDAQRVIIIHAQDEPCNVRAGIKQLQQVSPVGWEVLHVARAAGRLVDLAL